MSLKRKLLRTNKPETKKKGQAAIPAPVYDKQATAGNVFAFPAEIKQPNYQNGGHTTIKVPGMSLADYLAARIYCRQPWPICWLPAPIRARMAYRQAFTLLNERSKWIK